MKMKTLALTILISTLGMTSCSGANKTTTDNHLTTVTEPTDKDDVEKTLKFSNFDGIKSDVDIEIHYAQDAKYSVKVSAPQDLLDNTDISMNGSTITLKAKDGNRQSHPNIIMDNGQIYYLNGDANSKIKMYVTAPQIRMLNNDGGGMEFYAVHMDNDELAINTTGLFKMNVQSIKCTGENGMSVSNIGNFTAEVPTVDAKQLSLDNTGTLLFNGKSINSSLHIDNSGQTTFSGDVKGADFTLDNSGMCKLSSTFVLTNEYSFDNSGLASGDGDITAKTINISSSGQEQRNGAFKADRMSIDISGNSKYQISFTGGDVFLDCSGVGNFNLALDCRSIDVDSGGFIDVTLSGTADKTSFEGSGSSHLNTSKLNKF